MKVGMNLTRFVLAVFLPGAIFIWAFSVLNLDPAPFTPSMSVFILLFAAEVVAIQRNEEFLWAVISKSKKDKLVFALSIFLLGCLNALPRFVGVETWWVSVFFSVAGLFAMFIVIKLLGSKALNQSLSKKRNSNRLS